LKKTKLLAFIPARGGSKRLPGKNMLPIGGHPLVYWSIKAALESRYVDEVIVSSDDPDVLALAENMNVTAIKRPLEIAGDKAKTFDAIVHAVEQLAEMPTYILLLQPTSPLRTSRHIDEAVEMLQEKNADAVISVCEAEHSPLWSNTLPEDGSVCDFIPEVCKHARSQDLPVYYRLNGAIYLAKSKMLLKKKTFFLEERCYAYIMDKESSVDIDDEYDLFIAECQMRRRGLD